MAKLRKDSVYKKSSLDGKQASGKSKAPKTITKKMENSLKNSKKSGK